jgi:glucosyl-3-phosphoglycerate synthase
VRPDVRHWFARRTSTAADWPVEAVLEAKGLTTVTVVLPALNEEATVGEIAAVLRRELVEAVPLIDDLVVLDSGSTDRTGAVAAAAGARVVHRDSVLPQWPAAPGKGEAMWRALHATTGDVLVFVDADLREFSAAFVTGLLGPVLSDPSVHLVKAVYDRPLASGATVLPAGGGRVTELVARPLLNLHWPELAGFVQPLAGEYAASRALLEQLPFPTGYGVETGLLIDALGLVGLDAMAQVDLGVRRHRHQDDAALGRMAAEILHTVHRRLERTGAIETRAELSHRLTQFERSTGPAGDGYLTRTHDVSVAERPPLLAVPEYAARRARAS